MQPVTSLEALIKQGIVHRRDHGKVRRNLFMLLSRHGIITTAWITLTLLPLFVGGLIWLLFESRLWGLLLVILYPLYFIPYGFFVAMPVMVWIFRKPASLHRR